VNELVALQESVRSLLNAEGPDAWPRLAKDIGVAGLLIPSEFGGADASLAEACAVLEELGAVLSPGPMLGSAVLATTALLSAGHHELLPSLAEGSTTATLAWASEDGSWVAFEEADGRLTGEAHYLLDGDVVLALAHTSDGVGLFRVDSQPEPVTTMDLTRPMRVLRLEATSAEFLGNVEIAHLRDVACVALAAEQTGAAAKALQITVDYAKTRVQFGRTIGSFQAIQHRLSDLYVLVETARSAYLAALDGSPESAAVARIHCTEAFSTVAAEMIQLHGGIGITWEHDAHRYFKRAHSSAHLLGLPSSHLTRLSAAALS
jgi:alkylation response protein AidB-like acyl-CoA dehydrogenase